jgi:hypothetical protein
MRKLPRFELGSLKVTSGACDTFGRLTRLYKKRFADKVNFLQILEHEELNASYKRWILNRIWEKREY